jgi:hypothetical protein
MISLQRIEAKEDLVIREQSKDMNWRNTPPKRAHFDTQEEYDEAVESFYNELADEADAVYEARRLDREG